MTKRQSAVTRLSVILAALVMAAFSVGHATAQSPVGDALEVRIKTTDAGFECAAEDSTTCLGEQDGDFVVEVPQGQLIKMTFEWAHVGYVQEHHVVLLGGYKLETDELTFEHRESSLTFIADKAGTFNFKCDSECDLHDYMQRGYLKVLRGGGGGGTGAATFTPTRLSVIPSTDVSVGDPVSMLLELRDENGFAVPKARLNLFVDAEFVGTSNRMHIGAVVTDPNGVAFYDYSPRLGPGAHAITVQYDGGGIYAESASKLVIQQVGEPPSAYETEPIGLEDIRTWAPRVFAGSALVVWLTILTVLGRAIGVRSVRAANDGGKRIRVAPDA